MDRLRDDAIDRADLLDDRRIGPDDLGILDLRRRGRSNRQGELGRAIADRKPDQLRAVGQREVLGGRERFVTRVDDSLGQLGVDDGTVDPHVEVALSLDQHPGWPQRGRRAVFEQAGLGGGRGSREKHGPNSAHGPETTVLTNGCAEIRDDATMVSVQSPKTRAKVGFVLSGGGSRGAYEAGIIHYIRTDLAKRLGRHVPIDIVTGTSVGAINAAFIAATMSDPTTQAEQINAAWRSLRIEELISLKPLDILRGARMMLGGDPPPPPPGSFRYGGILDTSGLERFVDPHDPVARHRTQLARRSSPRRSRSRRRTSARRPYRRVPVECRAGAARVEPRSVRASSRRADRTSSRARVGRDPDAVSRRQDR